MSHLRYIEIIYIFLLALFVCPLNSMDEGERMKNYHARNYTWPLTKLVPDTPGWHDLMQRRFYQLEEIEELDEKYNGWLQTMSSALVAPNFTEFGWGLSRAPEDLLKILKETLHEGLKDAKLENFVEVISSPNRPYFINARHLTARILDELKPMHEEWSGVSLLPSVAYGLRAYRNESSLYMHVDKPTTHIISSILHIDHSKDSEPWPIVIEDFVGNTHEVHLESGDMLFYESSKCFHGRPKKFIGSWYSSIFVHYHPVGWDMGGRHDESHYAVPEHWGTIKSLAAQDKLQVIGTSFREPDCPDDWCALKNSKEWFGPAPSDGRVLTTSDYEIQGKTKSTIKDEL